MVKNKSFELIQKRERKMKKTLICALALTFLACVAFTGSAFATTDKGPAEITLESTIDKSKKPKPAVFPHAEHQKTLKCADCHHGGKVGAQEAYKDGMKIEKCESCHNKAAGMPKKLETFKAAAHKNCKGCHSDIAKKDPAKAALKKCATCHPKKK